MRRYWSYIPVFILLLAAATTAQSQPVILTHPTDTSGCAGVTVQFDILASNADYYQWQENDGTGWFDIEEDVSYASGENTPTLTLTDIIIGLNGYQYRCYVEDADGEFVISNPATLNVYESPLINAHPSGKEVCKNQTATFSIDAENVTGYQWQENRGTGWYNLEDNSFYQGAQTSDLQIYTVFGINNYEYRCKVLNSSCSELSNQATLIVNPLPQAFYLTGGGTICEGSAGVEIVLGGSQENTNYELIRNETTTVAVLTGTGEALTFGPYNEEGSYTVRAVHGQTSCINYMTGQAEIVVNPNPNSYEVFTPGYFCVGSTGTEIYMENSQQGIVYELFLEGNTTGNQLEGTGGMITFENISTPGSYGIKATNPQTGCNTFMDNPVTVEKIARPTIYDLSGDGVVCESGSGAVLTLSGSEQGVTYELLRNGQPTNTTLQGDGDTLHFENISSEGVYTARAVTNEMSCEIMMNGSVEVLLQSAPAMYATGGDPYLCPQGEALVTLSGSEQGVYYELLHDGQPLDNVKAGTGQPLQFVVDEPGNYTINAESQENGCERVMEGEVIIQQANAVTATAGADQQIEEGESAVLQGAASGGSGDYTFHWMPEALLENANIQNPTTTPLEDPHIFRLKATDNITGCVSEEDTTQVTMVDGLFSVDAYASNDSLCYGESANLYALVQGGSGSYDFYWYTPEGSFSTTQHNPLITPQTTREYIVQVDDGVTVVEDTLEIVVNALPKIYELSGESTFCSGSQGAELQLSGQEESAEYQLFRNGFSLMKIESPTAFTVTDEGTYTMQASRGNCSAEMSGYVDVEEQESPYVSAGDDQMVYEGESVQLNGEVFGGSGEYTYQWNPAGFLADAEVLEPVTSPIASSMLFFFRATDTNTGCTSIQDSVFIQTQGVQLQLQLSANNEQVCMGSEVIVTALPQGGTGDYSFQWSSQPPGFSSGDSVIHAYPGVPTWYIVTLSDGISSLTDSVFVDIAPSPETYTVNGGGQICESGAGVNVGLDGSETGVYYELLNQQQDVISAVQGTGNAIAFGAVNEEGNYNVLATSISSGCTKMMDGAADVYELETPQAFAGADQSIELNTSANLNGYGAGGSGEYAYYWSPADKVTNPTQPSASTINLTNSTLFTLEVTDELSGCTSTPDSMVVTVGGSNLALALQASAQAICRGEEVKLFALASGGSGDYNYQWSSDPSGVSGSGNSKTVYPEENTTYFVEVDDGNNAISKSLEVSVTAAPQVDAGEDNSISYGEPATLTAEASGGSGDYTFLWNPDGYVNGGQAQSVQTVPMYQNTEFWVRATDNENGCPSIADTVAISVVGNDLQAQVLASADTVCKGSAVSLMAIPSGGSGDYSYSWYSKPEGVTGDQAFLAPQVNRSTMFYVDVTDGISTRTDSAKVYVLPAPEKYVFTGDEYFCDGDEGARLELKNSQDDVHYQLNRNDIFTGLQQSGNDGPLFFEEIAAEGFYSVKAINPDNWCVSSMLGSVNLRRGEAPLQFDVSGEGAFCENEALVFELSGSQQQVVYRLYNDNQVLDSIAGNGDALTLPFTANQGLYKIMAVDAETGCHALMEDSLQIETYPLPDIEVTADTTIYRGAEVVLSATGGMTYSWNTTPPAQGATVSVSPEDTTRYVVEAINDFGCKASDSVMVYVVSAEGPKVNAFTPNGDGINDTFLEGYDIIVFNRWGKKLYEGEQGWDGTYNGKAVPAGTYYFVRTTDKRGNEITPDKGSVTVIRRKD